VAVVVNVSAPSVTTIRVGRPCSSCSWTFADFASLAQRSVFSRSEITSITRGTGAAMSTVLVTGALTTLPPATEQGCHRASTARYPPVRMGIRWRG
jgi:hypothetical protein